MSSTFLETSTVALPTLAVSGSLLLGTGPPEQMMTFGVCRDCLGQPQSDEMRTVEALLNGDYMSQSFSLVSSWASEVPLPSTSLTAWDEEAYEDFVLDDTFYGVSTIPVTVTHSNTPLPLLNDGLLVFAFDEE